MATERGLYYFFTTPVQHYGDVRSYQIVVPGYNIVEDVRGTSQELPRELESAWSAIHAKVAAQHDNHKAQVINQLINEHFTCAYEKSGVLNMRNYEREDAIVPWGNSVLKTKTDDRTGHDIPRVEHARQWYRITLADSEEYWEAYDLASDPTLFGFIDGKTAYGERIMIPQDRITSISSIVDVMEIAELEGALKDAQEDPSTRVAYVEGGQLVKDNLRWTVRYPEKTDPQWVQQLWRNARLVGLNNKTLQLATDTRTYQLQVGADIIYDPDTNEISEVLGKVDFKNEEDV